MGNVDAQAANDADGEDPADATGHIEQAGRQHEHAPHQQHRKGGNPAQGDELVEAFGVHAWGIGFLVRVKGVFAQQ